MMNILNKLDQNLFLWLNGFHAESLNPVMVFLSGQFIWLPFIAFFIWKGKTSLDRKSFGLFLFFMALTLMLSDVTSSYILKNIFTRLRPCRVEELKTIIYSFGQKCGGKFGFVSSHAANSSALVLFCLSVLHLPKNFRWLWVLPIIVGLSRIYLGVHYPGDIMGGVLVGVFWSKVMVGLFGRTRVPAGT